MSEQIKQIAMRIRDLREIAGLSVETVAKEFDLPVDKCLAYESGTVDIPVSFLSKVAHKFNVEMTTLLTGQEPHLHIYSLVRKDQGVAVERQKQYEYQSLCHNFIHKKAEPFLVTVDPDDNEPQFNSHPGQEFQYVLQGRMQVIIDDHILILNEGDSLIFDSNYNHSIIALDNKKAKFLAVVL